jgi:hypothetical protein
MRTFTSSMGDHMNTCDSIHMGEEVQQHDECRDRSAVGRVLWYGMS